MSLAVLLDTLFYLPSRWLYADAIALGRLGAADVWVGGGGGRGGFLVTVERGGEAEVVGGGIAFFEAALDLYHCQFKEDGLGLQALENL